MANIRCDIKNIRHKCGIRNVLDKNKVIFKDTEIELPIKYIIKCMNRSDVYVNGKLVETFQDAAKLLENIAVVESTPENIADQIAAVKEGDVVVLTAGDYSTPITVDKACIIKGQEDAVVTAPITITAENVVLDSVVMNMTENKMIVVDNDADVSLVGCKFTSESADVRTGLNIKSGGQVVIEDCTFDDPDGVIYNWIEFGIDGKKPVKDNTIIRNCNFIGSAKHNAINFYDIEEGANILIENCNFDLVADSNAIRISNNLSSNAVFTIKDCTYTNGSPVESEYNGFILFQDYFKNGAVQDFTKLTVKLVNLVGPNGVVKGNPVGDLVNQVYYVYKDEEGIITDHNQPNVVFL